MGRKQERHKEEHKILMCKIYFVFFQNVREIWVDRARIKVILKVLTTA